MKQLSCFLGCLVYLIGYSAFEVDAVDGSLFQVHEKVEWSKAEQTCQKNNGKLFKPNETSLDVSKFSEWNFKDELWVAATYINILNFESASREPNNVIRCEMCTIGEKCETTCLYKPCGNQCRAVCKYTLEPHNYYLSDRPNNWTEAKLSCHKNAGEFSDKIQNVSSLFSSGYCEALCIWTKHVIQVKLQTLIGPLNKQDGECGILHNGILDFTSCSTPLYPLCERVATTTMTTTQASRRTNGTNAIIITSSTYEASTVANESTKQTTFGINEELASSFVPVGDSPHKSEKGALIGGVVGAGVVLTIIIIIVVVFLLRRSKQNRNRNSNSQGHVHHDNVLKAKIHVNDVCDEINGEVTYSDKHTSIQIRHLERESITYATPSNDKGSSEIIQDKYTGIITNGEQMMTVLYSQVQKRPKAGHNLHDMNQSTVGDDEYDKINFDKSYAQHAEHLGDVYDQTNINCEQRGEYFENVYNKAEFYHERQNIDALDVYDKANFHSEQQDNRSANAHSDEKCASPGQISENVYDKADFHRWPQDESSEYL